MTYVKGQRLTADQLNASFSAALPAGSVSQFSASLLALQTGQQWIAGLGVQTAHQLGQPNGIATLDGSGHLLPSQVPSLFAGNFSVKGPLPWIDVVAYGAVGDGATDNTLAIGNALAGLPATGGRLYFPPGTYNFAGTIAPNISNVSIIGAGIGVSVIQTTSATNDVVFLGGTGTYSNCSIGDISLSSTVTRTAGAFIKVQNVTGGGITRVGMQSPFTGVLILGSSYIFLSDLVITSPVATGGGILISAGNNYYLDRVTIFTVSTQCTYGIEFTSCDSAFLSNCHCVSTGYGLLMNPGSGATVQKISIANAAFASNTNDGVFFNPSSGGTVSNIRLDGVRLTSNTVNGVNFGTTGTINAVQLVGIRSIDNTQHGVNIGGGTYIQIDCSHIGGNSSAASGIYNGINVAANVSKFQIRTNTIGASPANAATQKYGIQIAAGSSNNYSIIGNHLYDNVTAAMADGGTGTSKQIIGNSPATNETKAIIGGSLQLLSYATTGLLQTDSAGNVSVSAGSLSESSVRQTVLNGPQSNGIPTFLPASTGTLSITTINISPSVPFIVTAANGFAALTGDTNVSGSATGNFVFTATASNTNYLYVSIAAGALTPGVTTLQPIYQIGGSHSITNGQFTFDIATMTGYMGNGTTAPQANIVFVGECLAGATTVSGIVAYAYNGWFDSGVTNTLPGTGSSVTFNHNIGVTVLARPVLYLQCLITNAGYAVGDVVTEPMTNGQPITFLTDRLVGGFSTANAGAVQLVPKTGGSVVTLTAADWAYGMRFRRGF